MALLTLQYFVFTENPISLNLYFSLISFFVLFYVREKSLRWFLSASGNQLNIKSSIRKKEVTLCVYLNHLILIVKYIWKRQPNRVSIHGIFVCHWMLRAAIMCSLLFAQHRSCVEWLQSLLSLSSKKTKKQKIT